MSELTSLVELVRERTKFYGNCSHEQAFSYACEDIVEQELGARDMASREVAEWLSTVCEREGLDAPQVVVGRASKATKASASSDDHAICVRGTRTTTATALHELAHLAVGADSHGVLWRDEYVRLTRAHISVGNAALLHALYVGVGLEMSPWPASAHRL